MNTSSSLLHVVPVNKITPHNAVTLSLTFFLLLLLLFLAPKAIALDFNKPKPLSDEQLLSNIKIFRCTKTELDKLLPELQRRFPNHLKRLKAIAAMYRGAPYCTDPLKDEKTDWFPYAKTNCTMFVLYAAAFSNSRSYKEALLHMRNLHYKGKTVEFKNRYHFTTDRITDPANRYFSIITNQDVKSPANLKRLTIALNRKQDGSFFFSGRLENWSRKVTVSYIPRTGFHPEMLREIPEAVGIVFVKQSNWEKGIIAGHEGLLIDGDLYHCTSSTGVCVIKDFLKTEFPLSQWEGVILFRINEVSLTGKHWE